MKTKALIICFVTAMIFSLSSCTNDSIDEETQLIENLNKIEKDEFKEQDT
ncbi:hypothetical protein [Aquimarina algicola]|nr:hypothetical protein [Aquimarina algicola]